MEGAGKCVWCVAAALSGDLRLRLHRALGSGFQPKGKESNWLCPGCISLFSRSLRCRFLNHPESRNVFLVMGAWFTAIIPKQIRKRQGLRIISGNNSRYRYIYWALSILLTFLLLIYFLACCAACGISSSLTRSDPGPLAVMRAAQSNISCEEFPTVLF